MICTGYQFGEIIIEKLDLGLAVFVLRDKELLYNLLAYFGGAWVQERLEKARKGGKEDRLGKEMREWARDDEEIRKLVCEIFEWYPNLTK